MVRKIGPLARLLMPLRASLDSVPLLLPTSWLIQDRYHAQIEALPADDSSVDWSPIENATFQSYCTSAADIGWCLRAEARLVAKRASRSGSTRIASTAKASIGPIQLSSSTESLVSDLIEKGDAQFEV